MRRACRLISSLSRAAACAASARRFARSRLAVSLSPLSLHISPPFCRVPPDEHTKQQRARTQHRTPRATTRAERRERESPLQTALLSKLGNGGRIPQPRAGGGSPGERALSQRGFGDGLSARAGRGAASALVARPRRACRGEPPPSPPLHSRRASRSPLCSPCPPPTGKQDVGADPVGAAQAFHKQARELE